MRIALVSVRAADPCFPISLLSLHAFLKAHHPDDQIDIIDGAFEKPLARIAEGGYALVGIGAMTADYEAATILANNIRSSLSIPVILGGVHISKLPESFRDCFNVAVIGEGEEPLCKLVSLYKTTSNPGPNHFSKIPGLLFRDGSALRQTPPVPLDLSSFPHLDYSAIHPAYFERKASASFGRFGVEAFLVSSRGCPYKCVFCASSHFWQKIRYFPETWVVDEIKALAELGVDLINFGDDLFACNKKRLKVIGALIQAGNLHRQVTFSCSGNPGIFDDEVCELLKAINVKPIFFGFESGDERTLKYLKCGKTTVEDNKTAVRLCRRHGFHCWGGLIIGSPGETLKEMENTIHFIDWAKKHSAVRLCVAVLHPFPGTPVWETALKLGKVSSSMDFDLLKLDSRQASEGLLVDDSIRAEFIELRDRAYRHIHSFKWTKAQMLLRHSPLETLKFAFGAPQSVLKRLLTPTVP